MRRQHCSTAHAPPRPAPALQSHKSDLAALCKADYAVLSSLEAPLKVLQGALECHTQTAEAAKDAGATLLRLTVRATVHASCPYG